ncbi:ATP-binding cassette domain-containing protein [Fructilactobacillus hinvesii]|uniref:ATP-binding cassette domain-containing protein n=1 Tax=Fructilactobacillus hinvesii TaxID=2940300 RepID=A0ABY5BT79_9LACO|nr:ATP-binding cassette domain-containing protein [Fructilactobacillus hinvesii]USS88302.1 ATP-binding cassette domain-containing protein [Fructilactobacillus hinvesii]
MAIEIKNLTHVYQEHSHARTALQSINLTIPTQQITAIVGKTGSGKSTLIKHLNGLLQPTTGSVWLDHLQLTARSSARDLQQVRRKVGMVFQNPGRQLFAKTVLADVMSGPLALGMERTTAQRQAQRALELVHFPVALKDQDPVLLSGGQQRRAAMAGVLVLNPQVVIFDEPTAGLDGQGQRELEELLQTLHAEGRTLIVVTHEMELVARLASQVIVLAAGELAFTGTPQSLFTEHQELMTATNLLLPEPLRLAQQLAPQAASTALPLTEAELQRWLLRQLGKDERHGTATK